MKNWNIGILGHVDSGKTSIGTEIILNRNLLPVAKVLSDIKSTAAFDSCKQSQERGITIDLGFSSFLLNDDNRVTLVDCPGHASLIKTIICGAQIIDAILLVIDVTKGIQLQTAECIMLAELYAPRFLVVLNKIDLLPVDQIEEVVKGLKARVTKILEKAHAQYIDFVEFSAESNFAFHKELLASRLNDLIRVCPPRYCSDASLLMISDHCFMIKGKGSVVTGTILQGVLRIGDSVQIISKGKAEVRKGDRVAVLMTDVNSEHIERGIVCTPGTIQMATKIVARVQKISYFKLDFPSNSKLHVTLLNCTELATISFVSSETGELLQSLQNDTCIAVIIFPKQVPYLPCLKILGSKLDTEPSAKTCRFVFHGSVEFACDHYESFVLKERTASLDRIMSCSEIIGRDLIKKDGTLERFLGCSVQLIRKDDASTVAEGKITRPFGTSGKFRVDLKTPVREVLQPSDYAIRLLYKKIIKL